MSSRLSRLLLGVGLAALVLAAADRVERKAFVKRGDHFGMGRLEEVGGVRILHLNGRPFELGYEQGAVLKDELARLSRENWDYARGHAERLTGRPGGLARRLVKPILTCRARKLARGMDRDSREELRGLAAGSGLGFSELLALNLIFGIADLHDGVHFALGPPASQARELWHGFSSALGAADQAYLADYRAVIFSHPEGRLKYVSVGPLGASGVVTGLNEAGISISWSGGSGASRMGQTAREVLEQARNLDQAAGMVKASSPEHSGAIFIGSRTEMKAMLLKNSAGGWTEEEMKDGLLGSGACWPGAWKEQPAGAIGLKEALEVAGRGCAAPGVTRLGAVYEEQGQRVWAALGRASFGGERWVEVDFASESLREP